MPIDDPEQLGTLFGECVSAGDLAGALSLYEEHAAFVGPDGAFALGIDAIRERLEVLLTMKPQLTTTSSEVVVAGDIALISNRWRMTLPLGEGLEGRSTEVARRQPDGGWLYVIDTPTLADLTFE